MKQHLELMKGCKVKNKMGENKFVYFFPLKDNKESASEVKTAFMSYS